MSIISTTVPAALAREMANAGPIAVLTGAGVSAESGVPTFRDAQTGLWARFNPSELATPAAFAKNPQRVWEWYAWRRALVAQAEPNAGHRALAAIERRIADFTLITQNVDGLHQRAGSRRIVELHGNIARVKCSREGVLVATWRQDGPVPRCPACGALLRPDVVWFEEALPAGTLATAEAAARSCATLLVVGTSAEVYPAAGLPMVARACGAVIVEINPNATPLSGDADYVLRGPAAAILPALLTAAWPDAGR